MDHLVDASNEGVRELTVMRRRGRRVPVLRMFQTLIRWEWPLRLLNPLFGDFNPFLREFRVDPYPSYRALQTKHRVYTSRLLGSLLPAALRRYRRRAGRCAILRRSAAGRRSFSACNRSAA